ncbi:MAG: c-type cytochrome biogenesis protein CcmI [Chromatiaceae bacterium]
MTIFWILVTGLAGLALIFVIPPLLSRRDAAEDTDQDQLNLEVFRQQLLELETDLEAGKLEKGQYQDARQDLERELLHDVNGQGSRSATTKPATAPFTALALALALPAFAIGLYLTLGDSAIIPRLEMATVSATQAPPEHGAVGDQQAASLDIMAERLAARMEEHPEQMEGWLMLGRTYVALDQPEKGAAALARALALAPQNPEVMINLAQALATAANSQLAGRPAELIASALLIEPKHATGRWLNGLAAYQAGDLPLAVERWEALGMDLDAAGEDATELRQIIADAREQGGMPPAATPARPSVAATTAMTPVSPPTSPQPAPIATKSPAIQVQVSLAEPLRAKADPNQSLFVFAKAASGPPMPLAVKRLRVADLPLTVTLDDSLAMTPAMRLSNFPQVIVGARISASGQAIPQSGDLEGEVGPLATAENPSLQVVIDRVRP